MEEQDIMQLWKSYSVKLDESLQLNRKNAEDITRMKVQSFLFSMRPLKIFAIVVGVAWVLFADSLIIRLFNIATPFFLIAAIIQVLLTKLAIGIYLYQLVLIQQADISEPVHATQHKLAQLKSSTLWVARLLFLQMPVWTFFYWNKSMLENGNAFLYIVQAVVTLAFTYIAVWLFLNIKYENRNKKWFKLIFSGKEWSPVIKSMELLSQLDEYEPSL
ncbi:MAG TPA: hypothetical protein PKM63_13825 [Panacibacter sp.]|nr:hypothetical protein [Panacibacter sp.]HNP45363.1 hypothetical protein [Panacibacter sp.]